MMSLRVDACLRVLAGCLVLLVSSHAKAAVCDDQVDLSVLASTSRAGGSAKNAYLAALRKCLPTAPKAGGPLAEGITVSLMQVDRADPSVGPQQNLIRFLADLLWVLAEAGDPVAQQNLASMHNAQPGSRSESAIRQDQGIFLYWTRKAAAQGETGALFNLAMRFSRGVPAYGLAQDEELAYRIFDQLEQINLAQNGALALQTPYVLKEKQKIMKSLGTDRIALITTVPVVLATLAPQAALPGSEWDRPAVISRAFNQFLKTRPKIGAEASWISQQQCYADVAGVRTYTREHEMCVALDIANHSYAMSLSGRTGSESIPVPPEYEVNPYLSRIYFALTQAGMTADQAVTELKTIKSGIDDMFNQLGLALTQRKQLGY